FLFPAYAAPRALHSIPTRRSSDLVDELPYRIEEGRQWAHVDVGYEFAGPLFRSQTIEKLEELCRRRLEPRDDLGSGRTAESLGRDRKSTRLNSSHVAISYAVFCLK